MSRTKLCALIFLLAAACSSSPNGESPAPDAGTTTPDAGETAHDAGTTTPDAGDTTPDAGETTPDAGMNHEITGALVRVFNLNLQFLAISKGTNPATDAIPEFNSIAQLTLTSGPEDGYVEIPLGTTLYAWVGGPTPQQFTLPQDATAGAHYTAVATLRGLRLLADVPPTAAGARRIAIATDRDVLTVKSEGDQVLGSLSQQSATLSFELPAADSGFLINDRHVNAARVPEDGVGAFVVDGGQLYQLKTPGTQEPLEFDIRMSFVSLSFSLTNGADATLTATTPVGDITIGSATYQASSGAAKWVPLPISKLTATSTLGSAMLAINASEYWDTESPTVVVASDKQGVAKLIRVGNNSDDTSAGGQKGIVIINLTDNPLRFGVPFSGFGNGTMWFPEQPQGQPVPMLASGASTFATTTSSGNVDVQVSVNADAISDLTVPITGIVNRHVALNYVSSAGKYAFARLKADGSLVLTSQP
jgi:hypothetical protein